MAKRWYLMKSPNDVVSGFESEGITGFAKETFDETLETEMACDVELYTNDMSNCTSIRAIVQKSIADTRLNALHRHLFVSIGTCKTGMYVKYKGRFWLITGLVDDNHMYEKAVMTICNIQLSWMNSDGNVVQRWASITSASQYNNGLSYHRYYELRTDQLLVDLPDDAESIMITNGQRFIIDRRTDIYEKSFGDEVTVETSLPLITYGVTRVNNTLYDYGDSGNVVLLLTQDEQHEGDGYYVINDIKCWLCPYPVKSQEIEQNDESDGYTDSPIAIIEYESDEIYVGYKAEYFTAEFRDENGDIIDNVEPSWNIDCDFTNLLNIDYVGNTISISTDSMSLLNKSFELSLNNDGYESQQLEVKITSI